MSSPHVSKGHATSNDLSMSNSIFDNNEAETNGDEERKKPPEADLFAPSPYTVASAEENVRRSGLAYSAGIVFVIVTFNGAVANAGPLSASNPSKFLSAVNAGLGLKSFRSNPRFCSLSPAFVPSSSNS